MWNLLRVVLLHLLCFQRVVGSNDELHLVGGEKKSSYSVSSRLKDFTKGREGRIVFVYVLIPRSISPWIPRVLSSSTNTCIVLYLYIYIALLAVHTNQKCFQCEKRREKRIL